MLTGGSGLDRIRLRYEFVESETEYFSIRSSLNMLSVAFWRQVL